MSDASKDTRLIRSSMAPTVCSRRGDSRDEAVAQQIEEIPAADGADVLEAIVVCRCR